MCKKTKQETGQEQAPATDAGQGATQAKPRANAEPKVYCTKEKAKCYFEILHKELDLTQGVITRMAGNSFLLKGWVVTLIAVVLAISKDNIYVVSNQKIPLSIFLSAVILVFWYLDAFFLHKEQCYRELYEWLRKNRHESDEELYSLNYKRFEGEVESIWCVATSQTLFLFYGFIVVTLFVALYAI